MKTIEVVAAIIEKDGKIFATQRGSGDFKDGWEFPGGKVEKGESLTDAIIREIKEELATTIKVEQFLCTVEHDYPKFHLTMHCYICSILEGSLTLLEHESSTWLDKSSLDTLPWLPADIKVVEELKKSKFLI
jgi:8-oxo-dGTP diphosphatase